MNISFSAPPSSLRNASPRARIAAVADPDSVEWFPPAGASPHVARYGVSPQEDDGIVVARMRLGGAAMLVAAGSSLSGGVPLELAGILAATGAVAILAHVARRSP